ncbi:hypothetical protein ACFLV4_04500 [Chloroflexota bacterium]
MLRPSGLTERIQEAEEGIFKASSGKVEIYSHSENQTSICSPTATRHVKPW